ncbi:MAG: M15 family metallopeptidase [Cyanobacteria bacterium P01_A01_bin.105]
MNHSKPGSSLPLDDIPEARRDPSTLTPPRRPIQSRWLWITGAAIGLTAISASVLGYLMRPIATATEVSAGAAAEPADSSDVEELAPTVSSLARSATAELDAASAAMLSPEAAAERATMLGHRKYDEVQTSSLVPLRANRGVLMRPSAAAQVNDMVAAARAAGIQLGVASGFRSWEEQRALFFDIKAERGQTTTTRAEVSAPPGYSEHHTGYAVDFIDLTADPKEHLEEPFEDTPAFGWLTENASHYGFEMSFPKDNPNISYEPWHWRYVGDAESLEVFFQEQE